MGEGNGENSAVQELISEKVYIELKQIVKAVRVKNNVPEEQSDDAILRDIVRQLVTQYVRQNMVL